jgi:hypothetical protein
VHTSRGMSRKLRWIASIAAGIAAVEVGYVAEMLISGGSQVGAIFAFTNALTLIP